MRDVEALKRNNLKCPECGRSVMFYDMYCPDCGSYIDDTALEEKEDPYQEASDSFEEEYQHIGDQDDEIENMKLEDEAEAYDKAEEDRANGLLKIVLTACKVYEASHKCLKKQTRKEHVSAVTQRKYIAACRSIRGIYWVRQMVRHFRRHTPLQWVESWDFPYFTRVIHRLNVPEFESEILELFKNA